MNKIPLLFSGGETQPSDLSGLKLWLDASTLTGADGSAVTAWTDRSANQANFYQSTTASQPTLQTNELNGKNVVRFDGVDDFMNLTTPFDTEPVGIPSLNANSFSNNGQYYTVCGNTSSIIFYKKDDNGFKKMTDPATMPQGTIYEQSWTNDDSYFAVASTTSPRVTIYQRSGDTFAKISDPAIIPTGSGYACNFSNNNDYLAIGHNASPYITIYKTNKTVSPWTFTKLSNPSTLPAGLIYSTKFSPDDTFLSCAMNTSPYVHIYSRSGDTFTKIADPATLPTSTQNSISWLNSTTFATTGAQPASTNYIYIYQYNGLTFELLTTVDIGLTSATGLAYSRNKNYLAVSYGFSPRFKVYKVSGSTYTALANPSSLPTGSGRGVAWGADDEFLGVSHSNSPYCQIYRFDGTTLTNLNKLNLLRNVSGASVFVVRKCNSFAATSINVSVTTVSSGGVRLYSAQLTTSKVRTSAKRLDADTTVNLDATTSSSTTDFEILGHIVDYTNTDAFLYLNGVLDASSTSFGTAGNTQDTDSAVVTVGSFTGSSYLNGDIAEVIIYDRTLTPNEISQVHDYLQNKYYIYSPKEISGLQLWLDASTINQVDGTAVASWSDLSGNAYDAAQATTASQPTYKTNIQNGLGVVRFDGVDDFLSLSTGLGMFNNVSGATVIVVGRYAFDSTSDISFSAAVGGGSSSYRVAMFTTSNNRFQFAIRQTDGGGASAPFSTQTGAPFTGAIHTGVVNYSSTQRFVYVNNALGGSASGAPFTSGTTSATDSTYIYVGKYGAAGYELNGDVCEIITYNRVITDAEFRQLHQYLGRKWGITIA